MLFQIIYFAFGSNSGDVIVIEWRGGGSTATVDNPYDMGIFAPDWTSFFVHAERERLNYFDTETVSFDMHVILE